VDVWICPWPNGHIQAIGIDSAGRRQYRYHDDWRIHRDREKFERVLDFAAALPKLRAAVEKDLARDGLGRERVLAAIVRLLDIGLFRIGGEEYAEDHETFGVASLRKEHVRISDGIMVFEYPAKGSIPRLVQVRNAGACEVVAALRRRRSAGSNLFAYKHGNRWTEVHAQDVNDYIKAIAGDRFSAKDFRTWSATVLTAATLAENHPIPDSSRKRRRAIVNAVATVAEHLGNTPAVCRSAYVDPRVIDRFEGGETITTHLARRQLRGLDDLTERGPNLQRAVEQAVVDLINDDGIKG
jgi:DNA topoisomerase IB